MADEKDKFRIKPHVVTLELEGDYEGCKVYVKKNISYKVMSSFRDDYIEGLTEVIKGGNFLVEDGIPFPENPTRDDIESLPFDMITEILRKFNALQTELPKN